MKTGGIGRSYRPGIAMQETPPLESDESLVDKKSVHTDFFDRGIGAGEKDTPAGLLSRIEYIIDLAKGNVLTVEYDKPEDQLKSIFAEIPTKNYEYFCKELAGLAAFQSPPPGLKDKNLEMIQVRIRLLRD